MSFRLPWFDKCLKCQRPTMWATIDSHPTDRELAVQKFYCADCGFIKTGLISLKPPSKPRRVPVAWPNATHRRSAE